MSALFVHARKFCLLALVIFLVGCTAQTPSPVQSTNQPTPDLDAVRTEAAATVFAQMTLEAALNPSATQLPPTAVPATATPVAIANTPAPVDQVPTLTPLPTLTKAPVSGGVVYPTKSRTPYTDSADLVTQKPADYTVFAPNTEFDIVWTVKNSGLRDWNNSFYFRYISGLKSSTGQELIYTGPITKGGTTTLTVDLVAPAEPGNYTVRWGVVNDDGVTFFPFFFTFTVR